MLSKTLSAAAVALAASTLVSAQTFTTCNPLKTSCPADPAFGSQVTCDFTKGKSSSFIEAEGTTLQYNGNGAVFKINSETDAPTIHTGKYIFFGRIDVEVQAAAGQGIVTSAVLQSDDLDEIDWEWVGGDNTQVQTNYFSKGDTSTYDRGAYHPVSNPTGSFHTYSVEWTSQAVNWLIDGAVVRTLTYQAAKGGSTFPQTPMQVKLGTWVAGGKNAPVGTVQWAGGYTDFSKAPFLGYYKSIAITDYAGKDKPANGGVKEYIYGDNTGTYQSIKVVGGDSGSSSSSSGTQYSTLKSTGTGSKTTLATATSTSSNSSSTAAATTTGSPSNSAPSGSSKPTTVKGSGTSRTATAVGSVLLAGAGVLIAQLLL
ncbi:glycosidase crf1 [Tolypocladium capitatum]|uniref:Crh-like protein n=1 Tax=Tolypocladium capitatum TaxID=45235 RepID=A0A2K3QDG2_9HYPO|nr:glycosidase crf1 [Tolypocladium capitatum]